MHILHINTTNYCQRFATKAKSNKKEFTEFGSGFKIAMKIPRNKREQEVC